MPARTLPDRRAVLRGSAALIASVAMFAPLRGNQTADAATPHTQPSVPPTANAPQRCRVLVGLL